MGSAGLPAMETRCYPTSMLFFEPLEEHKAEKPYYSTIPFRSPVKREHYEEIEVFLEETFKADRVIILDHSLRRTGITNDNAEKGEEFSAPPSSRPHVVEDHPLAVCDARSGKKADLVSVDLVSPHYVSGLYKVYHNPNHKWYYLGS
ncbi:hypothetical protein MBLNU459_g7161t1 [Dothideomycetes sp. NU459]